MASIMTSLNFGLALYIKVLQSSLKCFNLIDLPSVSYLFTKLKIASKAEWSLIRDSIKSIAPIPIME